MRLSSFDMRSRSLPSSESLESVPWPRLRLRLRLRRRRSRPLPCSVSRTARDISRESVWPSWRATFTMSAQSSRRSSSCGGMPTMHPPLRPAIARTSPIARSTSRRSGAPDVSRRPLRHSIISRALPSFASSISSCHSPSPLRDSRARKARRCAFCVALTARATASSSVRPAGAVGGGVAKRRDMGFTG